MTTRGVFPLKGIVNPNVIRFSGRILPDTTAAPDLAAGRGITCAMAVAGIYVITLPVSFQSFVGFGATLSLATAADASVQVLTKSVTNRTISFGVYTGGGTTPLDVADATDNEIGFWVEVQTDSTSAT